jgi:hypothetical protein
LTGATVSCRPPAHDWLGEHAANERSRSGDEGSRQEHLAGSGKTTRYGTYTDREEGDAAQSNSDNSGDAD